MNVVSVGSIDEAPDADNPATNSTSSPQHTAKTAYWSRMFLVGSRNLLRALRPKAARPRITARMTQKAGFERMDPSSFFGSSPVTATVDAGSGVDFALGAGVMLAAASFAASSAF